MAAALAGCTRMGWGIYVGAKVKVFVLGFILEPFVEGDDSSYLWYVLKNLEKVYTKRYDMYLAMYHLAWYHIPDIIQFFCNLLAC